MKRINSKTGKPFERGDIREDGYYFYRYRMDRKLNPDGFYKEEWSSNPVRKTAKWITTEKAKIKGSKRINPKTNKPFERGDIREDGYIFQEYQKNILKNNGYLSEIWSSPDAYNRRKIQQAKYAKISRVKYNPKIHKRRLNPKTGEEFKIGDRDGDGRFFLLYHSEVQKNKTDVLERWAETSEDFRRYYLKRSLAKIKQRGKTRNFDINIDINHLLEIYPKDELCPALQIKMEFGGDKKYRFNSPSIDRIIPSKGYTKGNVRFVSYLANAIMNDANADEIIKVGEWLRKQNVIRHKDR